MMRGVNMVKIELSSMYGTMNRRTEEEIRAYVDGYNACYQQFYDCLTRRERTENIVKKMSVCRDAVNNVIKERREN